MIETNSGKMCVVMQLILLGLEQYRMVMTVKVKGRKHLPNI